MTIRNNTHEEILTIENCHQWHSFIDYIIEKTKPKETTEKQQISSWKANMRTCFNRAHREFFTKSRSQSDELYKQNHQRDSPSHRSNFLPKARLIGLVYEEFGTFYPKQLFPDEHEFAGEFSFRFFEEAQLTFVNSELTLKAAQNHINESVLCNNDFAGYNFNGGPIEAIGRTDEIKEIHKLLQKKDLNAVIIRGMAGIGKTYLSALYSDTYLNDYQLVLSCQGNDFGKMLVEILKPKPKIKTTHGSPSDTIAEHLKLLSKHYPDQILILIDDGREEIDQAISDGIKDTQNIHIIVAQRSTKDKATAKNTRQVFIYSLDNFCYSDAVELYGRRVNVDNNDENELKALLLDYLGGHPFMISVIRDWVSELQDKSPMKVIALLQKKNFHQLSGVNDNTDYTYKNMNVALTVSYERLDLAVKSRLLLLALFPRVPMDTDLLKVLFNELSNNDTANNFINKLIKSSLITEQTDGVIFHALMYDYLLRKWCEEYNNETLNLNALEHKLTKAAIKHIRLSHNKENQSIGYQLSVLLGYLLPLVKHEPFIHHPSQERLSLSLRFWYEHTEFQQVAYDNTLIDVHNLRLSALVSYLETLKEDVEILHHIVLLKMYAHYFYINPEKHSDDALVIYEKCEKLINQHRDSLSGEIDDYTEGKLREIILHVLDHNMNTQGRIRSKDEATKSILEFSNCRSINEKILNIIPLSLQDVGEPIQSADACLILRSAHYWGHRGNQDQFTATALFGKDADFDIELILPFIISAREAFGKAAYYRLCALKMNLPDHFNDGFKKQIKTLTGMNIDELGVDGLYEKGMETFESFQQGIGDTAHQYRGVNYLDALLFAYNYNSDQAQDYKNAFIASYKVVSSLYEVAHKNSSAVIQYHHWMLCNDAIKNVIDRKGNMNTVLEFRDKLIEELAKKTLKWEKKYNMKVSKFILDGTKNEFNDFLNLLVDKVTLN